MKKPVAATESRFELAVISSTSRVLPSNLLTSPYTPVETMRIDDGDELLSLAIDSRDVVGVFGRIKGPRTLLEMEMEVLTMLLRQLRPGHCRSR